MHGTCESVAFQIKHLHKEIFPFELLESNVFFLCQIRIDLNCNLEEYLYNISLSERWNDSTYSMTRWLRSPIAGSKGPCRFRSLSSLQDPHIFLTNWTLHISVNKFFILSKEHNTQRTAHLLVQEKGVKPFSSMKNWLVFF